MNIYYLILLALIGSVVSLGGGVLLVSNERLARALGRVSGSFAAGALIAAVLFDLLPEALEASSQEPKFTLLWAAVGITIFFLLERRLRWFHHHHEHQDEKSGARRLPAMLVVGDTIHNAIDGAAIALAYLADPAVGVVTTLAVALHEIPQEIGDFGLLLHSGWSRQKVILANIFSALATVVAAASVYFIGSSIESLVAPALALTAGTLLYIALSDVVPSIHEKRPTRKWLDGASLLFIAGAILVWGAVEVSHRYVHEESLLEESHEIHEEH